MPPFLKGERMLSQRLMLVMIAIPCVLLMFLSATFADIIKLKDGREIAGRLKEVTERDVVLEVNMGSTQGAMWFGRERVESINGLSVEEARDRISTQKAFIVRDKDKALISSAQEGLNFVSKTRKLDFKNTPELEIVTKEKIKEYLKKNIEKYYSPEKLETRRKLLVKLGLISKTEDYSRKTLEILSEETAGYYNPEDKKIYIAEAVLDQILPGLPSIIIMHEQVHALQDQYYDLKSIEESLLSENEDRGLAIQSLIEGEATVLMYDAFFRSFKGFGMPGASSKGFDLRSFVIDSMLASSKRYKTEKGEPAIFVEDLLFPYVWGGSFIQHLVNTKGWPAIDAIYLDKPISSEQIMHPEKYYIVRDEPKRVDLPEVSSILGSSWRSSIKDTLGEFGFYLVGKIFLDELSNKLMSEGWGGDSFELFEEANSHNTLFLSLSKWDSERDADEFFSFYKNIIARKYKQAALIKEGEGSSQWRTEEGYCFIAKSKDSVVIIEGASDEAISALIKAFVI